MFFLVSFTKLKETKETLMLYMRNVSLKKGHDYPKSYSKFLIRGKTGTWLGHVALSIIFTLPWWNFSFPHFLFFTQNASQNIGVYFNFPLGVDLKRTTPQMYELIKNKNKSTSLHKIIIPLPSCKCVPSLQNFQLSYIHLSTIKKTTYLYGLSLPSVLVLPRVRRNKNSKIHYIFPGLTYMHLEISRA